MCSISTGDRQSRNPERWGDSDGRRGILVRARPEAWRALKILAVEENTTLQALLEETINLRLRQSGRPPIA